MSLVLRIGLYIATGLAALLFIPPILLPLGGTLITAVFTVFFAATAANLLCIRVFERGRLADCGMDWIPRLSLRQLLVGIGLGFAFAALVILIPLALRQASFERSTPSEHPFLSVLFLLFSIL